MAGLGIDDSFPRVIPAKTHAVIDYLHVATNFAAAAYFAKTNKRAAAGALFLGVNVLVNTLMTDYWLGVFKVWSFKVHGGLDYSVAGASALIPELLGFADEPEASFFHIQGAGETLIAGLTDYTDDSGAEQSRHPLATQSSGRLRAA